MNGVMSYLGSSYSFLSLPIVNPLVKFFVEYVLRIAIYYTELGAFIVATHFRTDEQAIDFERASENLARLPKSASEEERRRAEQELIDRARDLIKFTT